MNGGETLKINSDNVSNIIKKSNVEKLKGPFFFSQLSHRSLKDNPMLRIIISWPCVIPMTKCCYVLSTGSDPMEFK